MLDAKNKKVKIHVEHLKKNFGSLEVLKDISTDIYEGEVVVVIGPSGSGKSTLAKNLAKHYGFVYVDKNNAGEGTLARSKKKSFEWYKEVIATNGENL